MVFIYLFFLHHSLTQSSTSVFRFQYLFLSLSCFFSNFLPIVIFFFLDFLFNILYPICGVYIIFSFSFSHCLNPSLLYIFSSFFSLSLSSVSFIQFSSVTSSLLRLLLVISLHIFLSFLILSISFPVSLCLVPFRFLLLPHFLCGLFYFLSLQFFLCWCVFIFLSFFATFFSLSISIS